MALRMRITEVPVPTRYFAQASSASFFQSSIYGCSILLLLAKYAVSYTHLGSPTPKPHMHMSVS